LLLSAVGCGDATSEPEQHTDAGVSFCQRYSALSADIGCTAQIDCSKITPDCDRPAQAWLDCIERDVSQCICESDGDLNCEGSYKPSEGPALCIDQVGALEACSEQ
jgi:hypothetical protein